MHTSPRQRAAVLLATALLLLVAIAAPTAAGAATRVRDAVAAYLAANPGGIQINTTEIAYDGGRMIVTVTRTTGTLATADCPAGWFCFYDGINFTYPRGRLQGCGWQDLGRWGWRNRVESAHYNIGSGTVGFLNEAGATDQVLFTVSAATRTRADVSPNRNKADYVTRTNC